MTIIRKALNEQNQPLGGGAVVHVKSFGVIVTRGVSSKDDMLCSLKEVAEPRVAPGSARAVSEPRTGASLTLLFKCPDYYSVLIYIELYCRTLVFRFFFFFVVAGATVVFVAVVMLC